MTDTTAPMAQDAELHAQIMRLEINGRPWVGLTTAGAYRIGHRDARHAAAELAAAAIAQRDAEIARLKAEKGGIQFLLDDSLTQIEIMGKKLDALAAAPAAAQAPAQLPRAAANHLLALADAQAEAKWRAGQQGVWSDAATNEARALLISALRELELAAAPAGATPQTDDARRLNWLGLMGQFAVWDVDGLRVVRVMNDVLVGEGDTLRAAIDAAMGAAGATPHEPLARVNSSPTPAWWALEWPGRQGPAEGTLLYALPSTAPTEETKNGATPAQGEQP